MHITMIDESVAFDGDSPSARPLGGPEKAFAGLAAALARRGHQISAINMCAKAVKIDGVQWLP
ncbi:MAG: glycosyltransferase family 1 protein, partial [Rhodospirillales bacterium]|nr:glycosyltransferase family 1 protein [Rhodospirillales bacterium]